MTEPQPEAVIFDIGGVFIDWDARSLYRPLFEGNDWAMDQFLAEVCSPDWIASLDAGKPFAEAIAERTALFPDCAALIDAFDWGFLQMIAGVRDDTVAILEDLVAMGVPVYGLTNFPAEKYAALVAAHPFMALFRDVVVSGTEGLLKPDPRIFALAVERFGVTPATTLYIDDVAENVAAAEAMGFLGYHYAGTIPAHVLPKRGQS